MGVVYLATNKINGKRYVGKSRLTLEERKHTHMKEVRGGSQYLFHRALRKYGEDGFSWEVLCNISSDLNYFEKTYIKLLGTKSPNGYNLTDGGEGIAGAVKAVKVKISLALKGKRKTLEHRRKLSEAHKGKIVSRKSVEKTRQANLGSKRSEETKRKISESNMGKKMSAESRAKISLTRVRYYQMLPKRK